MPVREPRRRERSTGGAPTAEEPVTSLAEADETLVVRPCRPYRIGQHAGSLRRRMILTLVAGAVVGGVLSALVSMLVAFVLPGEDRSAIWTVTEFLVLPTAILAVHWALIGPSRWRAIQTLVWTSRFAAEGYAMCTGIRRPTDRRRTRAWLESSTYVVGEAPEMTYWRAYAYLLLGQTDAARAEAALITDAAWSYSVEALSAQIDLADGLPMPVGRLAAQVRSMPESVERAVAAGELGAMTAQAAWTCARDDVTPILELAPIVEPYAAGFMLRAYWLPVVTATAVASIVLLLI